MQNGGPLKTDEGVHCRPARYAGALRCVWQTLLQYCLPGQCLLCGASETPDSLRAMCQPCRRDFWPGPGTVPRCRQCGIRLLPQDPGHGPAAAPLSRQCGSCVIRRPAFDATLALADYRAPLDHLALTLKFRQRPALADDLVQLLCEGLTNTPAGWLQPPALIVPVPLSARRLAQRGYNQAWELSWRLSRHLRLQQNRLIPATPALLMRSHSAAQSSLNLAARQRNMRRAIRMNAPFNARSLCGLRPQQACAGATPLQGLQILLIDDVMTSGATLDAAARALKAAGARRVHNLVLFRTA